MHARLFLSNHRLSTNVAWGLQSFMVSRQSYWLGELVKLVNQHEAVFVLLSEITKCCLVNRRECTFIFVWSQTVNKCSRRLAVFHGAQNSYWLGEFGGLNSHGWLKVKAKVRKSTWIDLVNRRASMFILVLSRTLNKCSRRLAVLYGAQ